MEWLRLGGMACGRPNLTGMAQGTRAGGLKQARLDEAGPRLQTEATSAGLRKPWGSAVDSKDCGPRGGEGRKIGEEW